MVASLSDHAALSSVGNVKNWNTGALRSAHSVHVAAVRWGAYLHGAQLRGARIDRAQLERAFLSDAQLQGATLTEAQLQGARLSRAQLQGANLFGAVVSKETRWPDGWDQARIARAGVVFEADVGSTGDAAQRGEE
jgi:hypothetical protein